MKNEMKQHFFQKYWLIVLAPCLLLQVAIFEKIRDNGRKIKVKKGGKKIFYKTINTTIKKLRQNLKV